MPRPAIGADHAHATARQQPGGAELGLGQRAGHGPEQVGGAEFAFLPRIEDGEFPAIPQPGLQRRWRDHRPQPFGARLGFMKALL